jgi:hypothetical protein
LCNSIKGFFNVNKDGVVYGFTGKQIGTLAGLGLLKKKAGAVSRL